MRELLANHPPKIPDQECFILDVGKTVDDILVYEDSFTSYGWSVRRFNKLHVGAFVIFRRPGKLTKDRKFEFIGFGYVKSITQPDKDGRVVATIVDAYKLVPAIRQGEPFVESFEWHSKKKTPGRWEHFWNQYGMNTISFDDFKRLLQGANCVPIEEADITDEELTELKKSGSSGFTIEYVDQDKAKRAKARKTYSGVARKLDFEKIRKANDKTGATGEEIIYDYLKVEAEKTGCKEPVHVSKIEGDGAGYDIRAFDHEGNEKHIEVKASKTPTADGFEMSANEIEASRDPNFNYLIYSVYELDLKHRTCKFTIFEGPIDSSKYALEPTKYRILAKS